jgi:hypothetical protein
MLYRSCFNLEVGDILFDDSTFLWFETKAAARSVFHQSTEEARECLFNVYKFIRRSDNFIFTSGYRWTVALFEFSRRKDESVEVAKRRLLRKAQSDDPTVWLTGSLIEHESEYWESFGLSDDDKPPPTITPVDTKDTIETIVDYLAG